MSAALLPTDPTAAQGAGANQLISSTYIGGHGFDESINEVAADSEGNVVIAGFSSSKDFPDGTGESDETRAFPFVAKLSADGSELLYMVKLGDGGVAKDLALDAQGNAYVTGSVETHSFTSTPGAAQPVGGGRVDAFVAKVSPAGALLYGSYLGTSGYEQAFGIDVDDEGHAYVSGRTNSDTFPTTQGAYDGALDGHTDTFVTQLSADGSSIVYSTLLGGSSSEGPVVWADRWGATGVAVDDTGAAYVAGVTRSGDFPVTAGAPISSRRGDWDSFVTKLAPGGGTIRYSTYLGGRLADTIEAIDLHDDGSAVVVGATHSSDFPTSNTALQRTYDPGSFGDPDGFVTRVSPSGDRFVYSTLMGGARDDQLSAVHANRDGSAFVAGETDSSDFPVTSDAFDPFPPRDLLMVDPPPTEFDNDQVIARLSADGSRLRYSTYLGGMGSDDYETRDFSPGNDRAYGIDVFDGDVIVGGSSSSHNFPTTPGAFREHRGANYYSTDATVSRLSPGGSPCTHPGTQSGDRIDGTSANDLICGLGGNDFIDGGGGQDIVYGGSGNDEIRMTSGWDAVFAGSGNDLVLGNAGIDSLFGQGGSDRIYGGSGTEEYAGGNRDIVVGGRGRDRLVGGPDRDDLRGGPGRARDVLVGRGSDDSLQGGPGPDLLRGGRGNDYLDGGSDRDSCFGGERLTRCD
ncbi:MAG TPA: hypothetical protein VG929_04535 [Actinomycetota bacterium]|nr:hypothetical protein [Actinomycetota bacterium]